jgi:hypothetical protein
MLCQQKGANRLVLIKASKVLVGGVGDAADVHVFGIVCQLDDPGNKRGALELQTGDDPQAASPAVTVATGGRR